MNEQTDPTEIVKKEHKRIQKEQLELEEVTVKLPKAIMDFYRKVAADDPISSLEYDIVDNIRAEIDAMDADNWIKVFNLGPSFAVILEDPKFMEE